MGINSEKYPNFFQRECAMRVKNIESLPLSMIVCCQRKEINTGRLFVISIRKNIATHCSVDHMHVSILHILIHTHSCRLINIKITHQQKYEIHCLNLFHHLRGQSFIATSIGDLKGAYPTHDKKICERNYCSDSQTS